MKSLTENNWRIISHVYKNHVALENGRFKNLKLPSRHFAALSEVIWTRNFCPMNRLRKEDSLRDAIGNWLYTEKFGAWRNPNKSHPYKENNKELWSQFCNETQDYSMREAIIGSDINGPAAESIRLI